MKVRNLEGATMFTVTGDRPASNVIFPIHINFDPEYFGVAGVIHDSDAGENMREGLVMDIEDAEKLVTALNKAIRRASGGGCDE